LKTPTASFTVPTSTAVCWTLVSRSGPRICTEASDPAIFSIGSCTDCGEAMPVEISRALPIVIPSSFPHFSLTTASTRGICAAYAPELQEAVLVRRQLLARL